MQSLGDRRVNTIVDFKWNTSATGGASITRSTDGSIRIYKNNSTTERSSSSGITDSEDFDGLTGVHHLRIDLSDDADPGFYAAGNDYFVVLQGAVIDTQSVNYCFAHFSIENRNPQVDVTKFGGTAGTFASGRPEVRLADGVTHGGSTALFRLGSSSATPAFHATNSSGNAMSLIATGNHGLYLEGSNAGLSAIGAINGGLLVEGGSQIINDDGIAMVVFGSSMGMQVSGTSLYGATFSGGTEDVVFGNSRAPTLQEAVLGVRVGFAQAGSASTITLDSGASAVNNFYNGMRVRLTQGTGAGEERFITSYVGATKVATVHRNWDVNPNFTTKFMVLHSAEVDVASIATPAEAAGRPTTLLGMLRRLFEWRGNKRIRDRATGVVQLRNAADDGDLETATQSTTGTTPNEVDTQTQGS